MAKTDLEIIVEERSRAAIKTSYALLAARFYSHMMEYADKADMTIFEVAELSNELDDTTIMGIM